MQTDHWLAQLDGVNLKGQKTGYLLPYSIELMESFCRFAFTLRDVLLKAAQF